MKVNNAPCLSHVAMHCYTKLTLPQTHIFFCVNTRDNKTLHTYTFRSAFNIQRNKTLVAGSPGLPAAASLSSSRAVAALAPAYCCVADEQVHSEAAASAAHVPFFVAPPSGGRRHVPRTRGQRLALMPQCGHQPCLYKPQLAAQDEGQSWPLLVL